MTALTPDTPVQTRPRRRRRLLLLFMALVLALLALAAWHFWPRERRLMAYARKVMQFSEETPWPFSWLSDTEIIASYHLQFWRFSTTGKKQQEENSSNWEGGGDAFYGPVVSPDHRWMLSGAAGGVDANEIHSSRKMRWEAGNGGLQWLPDSHQWVRLDSSGVKPYSYGKYSHLVFGDTRTPGLLRKLPLDRVVELIPVNGLRPILAAWGDHLLLPEERRNRLAEDTLRLLELRFQQNQVKVRTYTIPRPAHGVLNDILYSPVSGKIAWLLKVHWESPMDRFLHRLISSVHVPERTLWSLWTSDLDGSHAKEIGQMDVEPPIPDDYDSSADPQSLLWLPDGKRLSFVYKKALYVVPVD